MQKDRNQSKFLWFLGTFCIPLILNVPCFFHLEDNYTGLLSSDKYWLIARILFLLFLVYLSYFFKKERKWFLCFTMLAFGAFFTPWIEENSLLCTLHLLFAYSSFLVFNIMLFKRYVYQTKYLTIYLSILIFVFFLCLQAMEVSLLAEAIYGACISILLINAK